jgi:serine/threonine protein kinase
MIFRDRERIECCDHGPSRWETQKTWVWARMGFATVHDRHPDLPPAMKRIATACCVNFGKECRDEWLIREWRRQLEQAAEALATGFAGLPEPIDFFYTPNTTTWFPAGVSGDEPVVVYQFDSGVSLVPYGNKIPPTFAGQVATFIIGVATVLKSVHEAGFVLRQIPLWSVTWNNPARRYGLREGLGLAPIGQSNFHPQIGFPMVAPKWTAPECFDADCRITPASDVYALGKTVLALLGHDVPNVPRLPGVHDALEAVERRIGQQLPDRIRRLLLLALHPQPHQRPRSMEDVVGMVDDGPDVGLPPAAFQTTAKAQPAWRPPHDQKPLPQGPYRRPNGPGGGKRAKKGPRRGN